MMMVHLLTRSRGVTPPPTAEHARVALQGQSNCYGVGAVSEIAGLSDATLASYLSGPFARVFIWVAGSGYQPLQIGVNNQAITNCIGPEFGLAVRWMRERPSGNLYIDKHYGDGQPISYFQPGTSFYIDSQNRDAAAKAWLGDRGIAALTVGMLWSQGESDANATQATYQAALSTMLSARVADGLLPAAAKRLLVQMRSGTYLYGQGVFDAKAAYAASNAATTATWQMPPQFNPDNVHLSAQGQVNQGFAAFAHIFGAEQLTV